MDERVPAKEVSPQQLQANRNNANKSTGPRSAEGKRKSSRNSLKHGIFSKDLIVREGEGRENTREFLRLLEDLREDFQPVGTTEELQVELIAADFWRYRRVLRAERAEITNGMAEETRFKLRAVDEHRSVPAPDTMSNLLRYQTSTRRHIAQDIRLLHDLQKQRRTRGSYASAAAQEEGVET